METISSKVGSAVDICKDPVGKDLTKISHLEKKELFDGALICNSGSC